MSVFFSQRTSRRRERQSRKLFITVVAGATDAPRKSQVGDLATVLYGLHLGLVLFWLQDRSPDTRTTLELLAFVRDMLGPVRPFVLIPLVAKVLVRLACILGPMLGDESVNVATQ